VREADPSLITFKFTTKEFGEGEDKNTKEYFEMKVDRSKLRTVAFKALSDFLAKLHIYKSMGDYDSAKKFFDHYSEVDEEMLKVRRHVLINKLPRRLELQPNLFLQD